MKCIGLPTRFGFREKRVPKYMNKIVLFIEPSDHAFVTNLKIGNLFMNRFAIDESAGFEILNVLELGKTPLKMSDPGHSNKNYKNEKKEKGMGLRKINSIELTFDSNGLKTKRIQSLRCTSIMWFKIHNYH